jgi:hypothetical protein
MGHLGAKRSPLLANAFSHEAYTATNQTRTNYLCISKSTLRGALRSHLNFRKSIWLVRIYLPGFIHINDADQSEHQLVSGKDVRYD